MWYKKWSKMSTSDFFATRNICKYRYKIQKFKLVIVYLIYLYVLKV